jgi:hypothetical protein
VTGIVAALVAIGGLAILSSTPQQRAEAERRWDRIGRVLGVLTVAMVAYWIYLG